MTGNGQSGRMMGEDSGQSTAGFWARRLTNLYTAAATGIVRTGAIWLRSSGQWTDDGVHQRRGFALPPVPPGDPVWIHSASMGEVRVAVQFAPELIARGRTVIGSSMTESGFQLANDLFPPGTACFRVPFDLPGPVRRVLRHFHPRALVLVETEWWPNLLLSCAAQGVPVFVINGRLSNKSFRRYRLGRGYWKRVLQSVQFFYMRSYDDAERLCRLGIERSRVQAMGTLKAVTVPLSPSKGTALPSWLERHQAPTWIAGCTRPGEEEIILQAYTILRKEFPDLSLWIAPRHPQRFNRVAALLDERGLAFRRWSQTVDPPDTGSGPVVMLIDRMGLLADLYRYASVAFIGGSLKPYGGHNPLEPALSGVPVVFGQYMDNQRDAADLLLTVGLAREVWGAESLALTVGDCLRRSGNGQQREQQAADLLKRLEAVRSRVADDLCERLDGIKSSSPATTTDAASSRSSVRPQ